MISLTELLLELSGAFGPPGGEGEIRRIFRTRCPQVPWQTQRMGNIFAKIPGQVGGPRVMLAAHMDEVGIMVQSITEHGWARFITLGAWPGASLPAQRFRFHNRRNQSYIGVTGAVPPHFLREEERQRGLRVEDLHLDFGVPSRQVLADLGVAIGDLGVPDVQPVLLPTGYLVGKAWDDRAGCAVLLDVLQRLAEHPNVLLPVGTVQEEVGTRGMRVAGRELRPDVAIILEGAPTDERPGAAAQTVLGGGPQLRYYDATMIAHRGLVQWLADLAAMEGIPHQLAVRVSGGTDAGAVHLEGEGIPTVVVGVPVRYAHGHQGLISLADVEAAVCLLTLAIGRLDAATLARLVEA